MAVNRGLALAAVLGILTSAVVGTYAWAADKAVFTGCDRHMAKTYGEDCSSWTVTIVKRGGKYYMDGSEMELLRHPDMPNDGVSLAMKDRVGRPNMYYLVLPKKLDIYVNCEFGSCTYKRSIIGTCCTST